MEAGTGAFSRRAPSCLVRALLSALDFKQVLDESDIRGGELFSEDVWATPVAETPSSGEADMAIQRCISIVDKEIASWKAAGDQGEVGAGLRDDGESDVGELRPFLEGILDQVLELRAQLFHQESWTLKEMRLVQLVMLLIL